MAKEKRKEVDFDVDIYCNEAIRICGNIIDYKFDYSMESLEVLEEVIQHIRKMVREGKQNKEDLWALSCFFGTYAGEVYLRYSLNKLGFKWESKDGEVPLLVDEDNNKLSPITKIYKKFEDETESKDSEGTLIDFYNGAVMLLEHHYGVKGSKEPVDDDSGAWDYVAINCEEDFDKFLEKHSDNKKKPTKKRKKK